MYDLKIVRFLFYRSEPDRQKLMEDARQIIKDGAERLDQEFWYGVNSFSNLKSINDMDAAKMSLRLFTSCLFLLPFVLINADKFFNLSICQNYIKNYRTL